MSICRTRQPRPVLIPAGAAKDADEVADILDVADLAPESAPAVPELDDNLAGF